MAKLIINPTSTSRREIPLSRSIVSIGRDPSNDVVLPDAMVSRRHAVVEWRGTQYYIRDCNSSNGSLVNGDRVSERNLRDGDLVAIGTARLLFRDEVDIEEAGAKVVQHPSSPRLVCPACHADYRKGDQFCRQCGGGLAPIQPPKAVCTSCGTAVPLPARFCNACGHSLGAASTAPGPGEEQTKARPILELGSLQEPEKPPGEGGLPMPEGQPAERGQDAPARPSLASLAKVAMDGSGAAAAAVTELPPPRLESARPASPLRSPSGEARPAPVLGRSSQGSGSVPPRPAAALRAKAGEEAPVEAPAPFGPRVLAGLLDALVVGLGQLLVLGPVLYYWSAHRSPATPADVAFWPILTTLLLVPVVVALGCVYYVYYWGVKGATPGKRLLGLVVQAEDGRAPIGIPRATVRVLGYLLSGLLLGFGFWMIAFGGIGLHDKVAGTRVVRRGRS